MELVLGWLCALLLFSMDAGLLLWIGYNFLVEMQPEAQRRKPRPALLLALAMLVAAVYRIRLLLSGREMLGYSDA